MRIDITDELKKKGMSRYELANRVGVTYPTITTIYSGKATSIKFDILEKICNELDCTPNDILIFEHYNTDCENDNFNQYMNEPQQDGTE